MALTALDSTKFQNAEAYSAWVYDNRLVKEATSMQFLSPKTILIAAGPSTFGSGVAAAALLPIGLIQDFSIAQNKDIAELFEVGSRGRYYLQGVDRHQVNMSSVMLNGNSLMRSLYQNAEAEFPTAGEVSGHPAKAADSALFINLASRFFEAPTGLYVRMETMTDAAAANGGEELQAAGAAADYGSFYLEECYIRAHNMGFRAGQQVVAEQLSITYDKMVPVS